VSHEWEDLWQRALEALGVAQREAALSPDASASRSYYAAFYAVSALFALEGKTFRRHSEVEAAVHRDLVREGIWPKELGAAYTGLLRLREVGDYGGGRHVSPGQAAQAAGQAGRILDEVSRLRPGSFSPPQTPA
jgi:uncharacterized protein (UPF0332 family)